VRIALIAQSRKMHNAANQGIRNIADCAVKVAPEDGFVATAGFRAMNRL
jgi:hypothetical protein